MFITFIANIVGTTRVFMYVLRKVYKKTTYTATISLWGLNFNDNIEI